MSLQENILDLLKNEFLYRIENEDKYPDFHFPISEIASQIQLETKINPGELYPILENLSKSDIEFELIDNPEEPEDKLINFVPIADEDLSYTLMNFRYEEYLKIKSRMTEQFFKLFKRKRVKITFEKLKKEIPNNSEEQKAWRDLLTKLRDYFQEFSVIQEKLISGGTLEKIIKKFPSKAT